MPPMPCALPPSVLTHPLHCAAAAAAWLPGRLPGPADACPGPVLALALALLAHTVLLPGLRPGPAATPPLPCRMALQYKENLELRLKHAEQPDKFLDSEVDLDEHIKGLMQVGAASAAALQYRSDRSRSSRPC